MCCTCASSPKARGWEWHSWACMCVRLLQPEERWSLAGYQQTRCSLWVGLSVCTSALQHPEVSYNISRLCQFTGCAVWARLCVLQALVLPPAVAAEVELASLMLRACPFMDADDLLPVCYRCQATNALPTTQVRGTNKEHHQRCCHSVMHAGARQMVAVLCTAVFLLACLTGKA